MKVLGEHLYSTHRVALRELVQNAHDSCVRRRIESEDSVQPRITVASDPEAMTLTIEDNGAGLTRQEILDYLATVGRGYTATLRESEEGGGLIGAFGLGFLSAYFVSKKVELHTTSYREPDVGWHFSSRGGERFQLGPAAVRPIGTRVVLTLDDDSSDLASPEVTRALLDRYCGLLPIPIYAGTPEPINIEPPWRQAISSDVRRRTEYLDFARRCEDLFAPLCTIPIDPTEPDDIRGMLWIQDGWTFGTSDQRNVRVYVRGMLISDDARDLVPAWAGFAGGVIESDVLTPTASREDLQHDNAYRRAAGRVREALIDGLFAISKEQPAAWRRILTRHSEQLLGAAMCDSRLFQLLADELRVPTSEGELTLRQVQERSRGRIHVSLGEQGGYEEVLFRALHVPVVVGVRYAALPFCRRYADERGGMVVQLGTEEGNRSLFPRAEVPAETAALLRELLAAPGREVVLTRFEPETLPAVLVPDREVALKRRVERDDADDRMTRGVLSLVRMHTSAIDGSVEARLYVNTSAPAIRALLDAPPERRARGAELVRAIAELTSSRADEALDLDTSATLELLTTALRALLES